MGRRGDVDKDGMSVGFEGEAAPWRTRFALYLQRINEGDYLK